MGDGRIFLKTRRDASFNKDLSNEPNFDRIHLAGQYLGFKHALLNSFTWSSVYMSASPVPASRAA